MGPVSCPETSVENYHYTSRNFPEERRSQLLRGGSLKSRMEKSRFKSVDRVATQGPSLSLEACPHGRGRLLLLFLNMASLGAASQV